MSDTGSLSHTLLHLSRPKLKVNNHTGHLQATAKACLYNMHVNPYGLTVS